MWTMGNKCNQFVCCVRHHAEVPSESLWEHVGHGVISEMHDLCDVIFDAKAESNIL